MRLSTAIKCLLAASAAATPLLCDAASTVTTGTGTITASAQVNFQITVPQFLFLRVGTGTGDVSGGYATNATVDQISWALTAANVGTGSLAGTGGDLTGGVETAAIVGNGGQVTLTGTTTGALNDGAGDTISYATITATASKNTTATILQPPVLVDGGTSAAITVPLTGKITNIDAKWTYAYANATTPAAGTYGNGTTGGNGTVTYTASMP
jgi:hypothetical protein